MTRPGSVFFYPGRVRSPDLLRTCRQSGRRIRAAGRLPGMPQEFTTLAEKVIDALLTAQPEFASTAGDHRYDDRLTDLSAGAVGHQAAMLRDASHALSAIDPDDLPIPEQVDLAMLSAAVDGRLFELSDVREWEWNPLTHNPGAALYALMARPYAPLATRLESLAARLDAVPDAMATARSVLRDCPRIHVETAITQFTGAAHLIRTEVPRLLDDVPQLRGRVEPAAGRAAAALDGFVGWLRAQPAGARDPRLGRRLWEARLWHTLDSDLSAAEVADRAWAQLDRVTGALREASAELVGGTADDGTVRVALDRLAADRPDNDTIIERAVRSMAEATDLVRERQLVSLVDDPCVVRAMPEFARGVSVAYCDPPGALDSADVPTFYCISPTPAHWSPEQVASFYREYNDHMLRSLTAHEAVPGHFLQLAHARRYRGSTRTRAVTRSGTFVEGWAVYADELMVEHGFGGLPARISQLKTLLRVTLNAILDRSVHCEGMPEAEAMALVTGRGFQEPSEAAEKWRRTLLTSTQLSTYLVGYLEMSQIARARPATVPLRTWHDAMLSHGCPSPRQLRVLMDADRMPPLLTGP